MDMDTLSRGIRNPEKVLARARRSVGRVQNRVAGCDVMAEDWDNLLVLDACRYDMFERLNTVPGRLESRRSKGSATREFVQNNFAGGRYDDTVYVTGNPFVSTDAGDAFHDLYEVWRTDWDDEVGTVRPEAMRDALIRANEAYPNKRLVGHLMQPHHPFIGPTGRELLDDPAGNEAARRRMLDEDEPESRASEDERDRRVWIRAADGRLSLDDVREAYAENLEVVLPTVEALVEELPGMTVVTSDHGNLMDEPAYGVLSTGSRRFAHPKYATGTPLVKVPWLVCPSEERKRVTEEPPTGDRAERATREEAGQADERELNERLEALGYR